MKQRCYNPNVPTYHHYGGRGITVCDEWKDDFEMFVFHMGEKPSPKHTLDRVDNDHIYCPENCRWATQSEQVNNSRAVSNAKGYRWHNRANKWAAFIKIDGRCIHLGLFTKEQDARQAYLDAKQLQTLN